MNLNKFKSIAFKSDHRNYKHVAIVMKNGNILATGFNKGPIHAEVNALEKIWPKNRKGTIVISLRFTNKGLASSMPCYKCRVYMQLNKVSKYQYVEKNPFSISSTVRTDAL